MIETLSNQYEPDRVSPPGETLAEMLQERQMTQVQFADRTGKTTKFVNEVIKGKASITPAVALEFQRVLGVPSSFWNNRQCHYDAHLAILRESKALEERLDWAQNFPYNQMSKLGWVPQCKDKLRRLTELLDFFGVANPDAWDDVWNNMSVSYRKPENKSADGFALKAWLRKGELVATDIDCDAYDRDRFIRALQSIRSFTLLDPSEFVPRLSEVCASCGVVVAFVPELPKTASGATRWLSKNKALIQISLRYKSDDHLWFTFFHEAAHILRPKKRMIFVEAGILDSYEERAADRFAANILIPLADFDAFVETGSTRRFSKASIRKFATEIGIAPGIVVGRLQREEALDWSYCNDLKRKLVWT